MLCECLFKLITDLQAAHSTAYPNRGNARDWRRWRLCKIASGRVLMFLPSPHCSTAESIRVSLAEWP
jgi:hypothetical protein